MEGSNAFVGHHGVRGGTGIPEGSIWTAAAAALSLVGVIHAYVLTPAGVQNRFGGGAAKAYAMACLLAALLLVALHY